MTNPAPHPPSPSSYQTQRAIVLRQADADVVKLLRELQADVNRMLKEVASRPKGIGRDIREAQLRLVQRNLHAQLGATWRRLGDITAARRAEAAERAAAYSKDANTFRLVTGGLVDGAEIAQAIYDSEVGNAASGLDRMIARTSGASYVPLKDRVYNSDVNVGSKVDKLVNSALARGLSAVEFANEVRSFINPATPGGVRYAAMRLARTEINNAAHAMAVESVRDTPWVEDMEWKLSGSHGRPDVCDSYAKGGPNSDGRYPKRAVPAKPHPQCLCYPIAVTDSDEEFERKLLGGEYNTYLEKYRNIQPGQVITTSFGGFTPPPHVPSVVKPTKAVTPPKAARAKVKPPVPGATVARTSGATEAGALPAPPLTPAEWSGQQARANRLIAEGNSLAKTRNTLAKEFGMSKEESERIVRQMASTQPGSVAARQANLTALKPPPAATTTKPTSVAPPKPARVTSAPAEVEKSHVPSRISDENLLPVPSGLSPEVRDKVAQLTRKMGGDVKLQVEREMQHQGVLVPGAVKRLDNIRIEVDPQVRGKVVNAFYHHKADIINRRYDDEIVLGQHLFEAGYGKVQLDSEITGFKSSCGELHTGGQSVTAHEFGHHVDWVMQQNAFHGEIDALWSEIADTFGVAGPSGAGDIAIEKWFQEHKDLIKTRVSEYASANRKEFFAEIWREYSGNANARPHVRRIGQKIHDITNGIVS